MKNQKWKYIFNESINIYYRYKMVSILPYELMEEIFSHLNIYEQISFCHVNKNIKCQNVDILKNNIKLQTNSISEDSFIIKNGKLYHNNSICGHYENISLALKTGVPYIGPFHEIETPGIPISISSDGLNYCVLTDQGLYYSINSVLKRIDIKDKILHFQMIKDTVIITTPKHIIFYKSINTYYEYFIPNCIGIKRYNIHTRLFWSKNGLHEENIKLSIDDLGDILDVATIPYNKCYILTTKGLYKNVLPGPEPFGKFYRLSEWTFKLIDLKIAIKHIASTFILTLNNELYQLDEEDNIKLIAKNIKSLTADYSNYYGNSCIVTDIYDDYYVLGPKFRTNKLTKIDI
jgi:hypothetical protein